MKKNEIIELNGKEYTLELNRDSFLQIDKICDVSKSMSLIQENIYDYIDEIDDNYNPLENTISDEEIEKAVDLKVKTLSKLATRSFFIWLYPNHKLTISQVKELIEPLIEDEEKSEWIAGLLGKYLRECIEIRQDYNKNSKNLKALASK